MVMLFRARERLSNLGSSAESGMMMFKKMVNLRPSRRCVALAFRFLCYYLRDIKCLPIYCLSVFRCSMFELLLSPIFTSLRMDSECVQQSLIMKDQTSTSFLHYCRSLSDGGCNALPIL